MSITSSSTKAALLCDLAWCAKWLNTPAKDLPGELTHEKVMRVLAETSENLKAYNWSDVALLKRPVRRISTRGTTTGRFSSKVSCVTEIAHRAC